MPPRFLILGWMGPNGADCARSYIKLESKLRAKMEERRLMPKRTGISGFLLSLIHIYHHKLRGKSKRQETAP